MNPVHPDRTLVIDWRLGSVNRFQQRPLFVLLRTKRVDKGDVTAIKKRNSNHREALSRIYSLLLVLGGGSQQSKYVFSRETQMREVIRGNDDIGRLE